ncbi:MAG: MMPL family transporter, partial [Desulfobulbaceae bacterium]|nr:MMPL family transporter [Desulfobulbaceae bacterium]
MKIGSRLIQFPLLHPKLITAIMVVLTLVLGAMIVKVQVDTDPENMLSEDEAARVFHNQMKKEFTLHDVVVLGVVNDTHPDGVFNPETLGYVHILTEFAKTLVSEKYPDRKVVSRDIMAPGNVDTILQAGLGQIRFEWLMKEPPKTRDEALMVREHAMNNPLLKGTLVAEDGKAIGIYLPITSKHFAHEVSQKLLEKIEEFSGDDQFFITGLPVAEDTFGKEMFVQMAVSAPLAMLAIFILMLIFFRKIKLIISPMIVAMVTVISTMGLLIGTGNTLHIMSSMIPIFLMPIAVVDSIHILSEFFDEYQKIGNRRKTIEHVMDQLFMPMLYTSLTSSAGFASLAFTPIPPVQVFGIFVAFGIMLAWFITITFIPAYIMMMKEESLDNFGVQVSDSAGKGSLLSRMLNATGSFTYTQAKFILVCTLGVLIIAGYGITKIEINDNPMNWFSKSHPIRVADRALNSHFGGTYEAYLIFEAKKDNDLKPVLIASMLNEKLDTFSEYTGGPTVITDARQILASILPNVTGTDDFLLQLEEAWQIKMDDSDDDAYEVWGEAIDTIALLKNRN